MQAEAVQRVVAVAVFRVAAYGVAHVGGMYTNLVLTASLQLKFHQRVLRGAVERKEVCDSQFAAIVYRTAVGDVGLVVLQPVLYRSLVLLHLAAEHGHIAAVVHNLVPVSFQRLLRVHVLGIDHQPRRVSVQPVHCKRFVMIICSALLS